MKPLLLFLAFATATFTDPPVCSPGAVNPEVTQANIHETICDSGWTKTVRPPARFTNKLKRQQMKELNITGSLRDYEEDHRVPLEVGGAPQDPKNLWPQPWPEARKKDRLETAIKKDVCLGALTLKEGQAIFLGDFWSEYERRFEN